MDVRFLRDLGPDMARVAEVFPQAWVFSHFDSRGGSTLVVTGSEDTTTTEAIREYALSVHENMRGHISEDQILDWGLDDLREGFGPIPLIVLDETIRIVCFHPARRGNGELLNGYTGVATDDGTVPVEGYAASMVNGCLVLHLKPLTTDEAVEDMTDNLGEDAYGLLFHPMPDLAGYLLEDSSRKEADGASQQGPVQ